MWRPLALQVEKGEFAELTLGDLSGLVELGFFLAAGAGIVSLILSMAFWFSSISLKAPSNRAAELAIFWGSRRRAHRPRHLLPRA